MKKQRKIIFAGTLMALMVIVFMTGIWSNPSYGAAEPSYNKSMQNYTMYSKPMTSFLTYSNSQYMRVEYLKYSPVVVTYYDTSFSPVSQRKIPLELENCGGFYEGKDCYFLVFGHDNSKESDSQEVIRIVKYDKNWKRLGAASLKGANTVEPFWLGSLRMTEYGGYLYIRTSHLMYTSKRDGINHQANLTIQVRLSDMQIVDSYYDVMNVTEGYVSHSFNQFILADDEGNLVALDHGDAYPRGAVLGMYDKKAGEPSFTGDYFSDVLMKYKGKTGQNYTGASLGGLEYSSSSYITVGNFVRKNNWDIYVTSTPRAACTKTEKREYQSEYAYSSTYVLTQNEESTTAWITNYGNADASTPQLVKMGADSFLLLWEQYPEGGGSAEKNGKISYCFLNGEGKKTGSIKTGKGYLSDCKPIAVNGKAVWYVTDRKNLTFYTVDSSGALSKKTAPLQLKKPNVKSAANATKGISVKWEKAARAVGYQIYRKTGSGKWTKIKEIKGQSTVSYTDKSAKNGKTYTYKVRAFSKGETGPFGKTKKTVRLKTITLSSAKNSAEKTAKVKWKKNSKASGYQIQYDTGKSSARQRKKQQRKTPAPYR